MATMNGAAYLDEQIQSLADQTCLHADLWVSDDGSTDATLAVLDKWKRRWSKGAFHVLHGPRQGFAENFRSLIANKTIDADYFAFCDQDDVWEPNKLQRAIGWMERQPPGLPLLFCSRTLTITSDGVTVGRSPLFLRPPSFRNALVQSLAGGNTMIMNRAARELLRLSCRETGFVSHDWWAYLIVTGAGGKVYYSRRPLVRYRQHRGNQVGANMSWHAKLSRLKRLFEGQFLVWTDRNMEGLRRNMHLLTGDARQACELFLRAREGTVTQRLRNLWASGVYRQTVLGSLALYLAVVMKRI